MRYEMTIREPFKNSIDKETKNSLISCLVRYGYAVYLSDNDDICFTVDHDELEEIKEK
jgi:hypothetical protein